MHRSFLFVLVLILIVASTACVSSKRFESTVSDVTTRVDGVEGEVEEQGRKIESLEDQDRELVSEINRVEGEVSATAQQADAAQELALEAQRQARGKVVWEVTLSEDDVVFGIDQVELSDSGRQRLDELVQQIRQLDQAAYVEIAGHTDSTGSEAYNVQLGRQRAENVRNYLYEQGIPLHMMEVVSFGESKPIADNSTAEGRSENRRVEVRVLL
jgi:outer membrane protein OmpA-like peptidoglycan-associated protein